jgi:hypothetical protein
MRGGQQPTKKDFINHMLNEQRGNGNNNSQQNSITPDPNTERPARYSGRDYIFGMVGNELIQKVNGVWKKLEGFSSEVIAKIKKDVYNIRRGQSVYDTPDNSNPSSKRKGGWLKDPNESKMYVYKVKNCKWLAKNVKTGKVYDISDNPAYKSSVDILNKAYPNALKGCEKIDNTQTGNTQTITTPSEPTTPPVVLPTWAECIGRSLKGAVVTKDESNVEIIMAPFGKDMGYFWNDKTFMFVYANGEKLGGTWSCEGNDLLIKTNDGEQWTLSTQWIKQPSKSINPSVNYQTTRMRATDVANDSSTPADTTKSDKSDSTDQFKAVDLPKDIGFKPSKPDIKNESYNGLEDVLSNIDSLINEIEMKEIINEQTQRTVVAPAQELDILYKNPVLKTLGPVETLCEQQNGVSIPVNINGKKYFAGRRTNLNQSLGGGEGYFVYDGKILRRTQGCNFEYVKKGNDFVRIDGIEPIELELPFKELLSRFGINNMDYNSNPYYFIDTITKKFQNLIAKGARSTVFRNWQELLMNYYKYDNNARLQLTNDNQNNPPQDELGNYVVLSADKLGIQYMDKQIQIFVPRGASLTNQFKAATYN